MSYNYADTEIVVRKGRRRRREKNEKEEEEKEDERETEVKEGKEEEEEEDTAAVEKEEEDEGEEEVEESGLSRTGSGRVRKHTEKRKDGPIGPCQRRIKRNLLLWLQPRDQGDAPPARRRRRRRRSSDLQAAMTEELL
ncbi:unnamed protein product [Pleuronectes platessa]|uniref:Uncharacterized protein n=1 Tax=Pleuronectes platessa TaxID=8262 RepID=A0A9N7Y9U5_PLEPL|nr:unnamed protein product [Pleuronectes platessa]